MMLPRWAMSGKCIYNRHIFCTLTFFFVLDGGFKLSVFSLSVGSGLKMPWKRTTPLLSSCFSSAQRKTWVYVFYCLKWTMPLSMSVSLLESDVKQHSVCVHAQTSGMWFPLLQWTPKHLRPSLKSLQIWHRRPLGLKDELFVHVTAQTTFDHNSRIYTAVGDNVYLKLLLRGRGIQTQGGSEGLVLLFCLFLPTKHFISQALTELSDWCIMNTIHGGSFSRNIIFLFNLSAFVSPWQSPAQYSQIEQDALKIAQEITAEYWAVSSLTGKCLDLNTVNLLH